MNCKLFIVILSAMSFATGRDIRDQVATYTAGVSPQAAVPSVTNDAEAVSEPLLRMDDFWVACCGDMYDVHYRWYADCLVTPPPPQKPYYPAVISVLHGSVPTQVGADMYGTYVPGGEEDNRQCVYVEQALGIIGTNIPIYNIAVESNCVDACEMQLHTAHDFATNWVTLWGTNNVEHQCGVVTSNYFAILTWHGKTNRVNLDSEKLVMPQPPQRDMTNPPQEWFIVTNKNYPTVTNFPPHEWFIAPHEWMTNYPTLIVTNFYWDISK